MLEYIWCRWRCRLISGWSDLEEKGPWATYCWHNEAHQAWWQQPGQGLGEEPDLRGLAWEGKKASWLLCWGALPVFLCLEWIFYGAWDSARGSLTVSAGNVAARESQEWSHWEFIHSLRYNVKLRPRYCPTAAEGEMLRKWVHPNWDPIPTVLLNKSLNLCSNIQEHGHQVFCIWNRTSDC